VLHPNEVPVRINREAAVTALVYGASEPRLDAALILAHGAGAGQQSTFMTTFARALAGLGIDTVTFNFLYTEQKRRIPDRPPALEACYAAVCAAVRAEVDSAARALFIGGKSMGGRIATQVAASGLTEPPRGIVLLGYPLHPPGRPHQRRDSHLPDITCPMLFVQGSRDAFGTPAELAPIIPNLRAAAAVHEVAGGDHSFKVSTNPARQAAVFADVQRTIVRWVGDLVGARD
jgi:predicted alpha/beta-hydrolase family hydrolase